MYGNIALEPYMKHCTLYGSQSNVRPDYNSGPCKMKQEHGQSIVQEYYPCLFNYPSRLLQENVN